MLKVLYNGRSGLNANQNRLDAISNNLANTETSGYKRVDVSFQDVFYEKMDQRLGLPLTGGEEERKNLISGSGSRADKVVRDYTQGLVVATDREEDFAIQGKGYFKLKDKDGNAFYTRDGEFSIDRDGYFIHSSGNALDTDYDPSKVKKPIKIDEQGNIFSDGNFIGEIKLYDFVDRESMLAAGNNLYKAQVGKEANIVLVEDKGDFTLKQGFLERSNVDMTRELTDMMITQRAFELNSRSIKAADEMWQMANNLRGR
jgi:flagellar basal-body rod protein FlgG